MLIDSGSDLTIIDFTTAYRLHLSFKPLQRLFPRILGANNTSIDMVGMIRNACLETPSGYIVDTVWVAKNLTSEAILGQSSLSAFQALTFQYGGHLPPLSVNQVISNTSNASTFTTHLPVQCFPHLHSAQKPIRAPARRQQPADKLFIRSEIQRLLKEGKIRPSNSSWRSQAFVVREPNRKPRMVINYSQTINRVTHLDAFPIPLVSELLEQVGQYRIFSYIDLKAAFHQFRLDPKEWYLAAFEADGLTVGVHLHSIWPA